MTTNIHIWSGGTITSVVHIVSEMTNDGWK